MAVENGNGRYGMQNPGDLRVPDGVVIEPTKRTLIVTNGTTALVERGNYDQVVELSGSDPTTKDEEQTLKETTLT